MEQAFYNLMEAVQNTILQGHSATHRMEPYVQWQTWYQPYGMSGSMTVTAKHPRTGQRRTIARLTFETDWYWVYVDADHVHYTTNLWYQFQLNQMYSSPVAQKLYSDLRSY